jgi:Tfp pilus assembly protein FimT
MTPSSHFRSSQAGYSLIELTIATGVLAAGIAAAASLTLTSARIEEMNHRKARVVALTEASARLWQLGLTPSQVAQLLPGDPALASIDFDADTAVPNDQGSAVTDPTADLGTFEQITVEASVLMRESSGPSSGDAETQLLRPVVVIR